VRDIAKKITMVVALIFTLPRPAPAIADEDTVEIIPKSISVFPFRRIPGPDHSIFKSPETTKSIDKADKPLQPIGRTDPNGIKIELLRTLKDQPEFKVIPWEEVLHRLNAKLKDETSEHLFRNAMELGVEQYRALRVKGALETLQKAEKLLHRNLIDLKRPRQTAQLYLYLGLCFLEEQRVDDARLAFGRMFFYHPDIQFQSGFFPPRVEESLRSAYRDFVRAIPTENLSSDGKSLKRLYRATGLELILLPLGKEGEDGEVELRVLDLGRGIPILVERIDRAKDTDINRAASRFVSRFVACHTFRTRHSSSFRRKYRKMYVAAEIGYHTYVKHPTRNLIHNMSIGVRAGKSFSPHIGGFASLSVLSSFEERFLWIKLNGNQDLDHRLASLRMTGGLEFKMRWGKFTWYVAPGLEAVLHPEIRVITSAECKFFGLDHPNCAPKNVKVIDASIPMGFNAGAGVRFRPKQGVFLGIHLQSSLYLLPLDKRKVLDYPFTASFSLGFDL
jgi:hypothetical protein